MRAFLLFFAAYLFALTLVPCQDMHVVAEHAAAETILTEQPDHSPGHYGDTCTPLCTCACCGTFLDRPAVSPVVVQLDLPPGGNTKPTHDQNWNPVAGPYGEAPPPRA